MSRCPSASSAVQMGAMEVQSEDCWGAPLSSASWDVINLRASWTEQVVPGANQRLGTSCCFQMAFPAGCHHFPNEGLWGPATAYGPDGPKGR